MSLDKNSNAVHIGPQNGYIYGTAVRVNFQMLCVLTISDFFNTIEFYFFHSGFSGFSDL